MSYQALYRVWRPQTFDQLVGQTMIASTLSNSVNHHQLTHAYLFTGPRGTGKTSAAKIMAKAVNCLNPQNGNPCNECELCQSITNGESPDVIEIDAASNNGVDEIRDLRDKVRYAPSIAKYKVYIIDEVHMLTTGAFNALLKTLEEPPEHVIFILATTEPHKIPATIISRTQRFDFQRIKDQDLVDRMAHILESNHVQYQKEALEIIARAANGGMRDSLSLLDQALSYQKEAVSIDSALEVSGSVSHQTYLAYLNDVYHQNGYESLKIVKEAMQSGKQASRFMEELMLFVRDLLLSKHIQQNYTLLQETEWQELVKEIPNEFFFKLVDYLNQAQNQMRFSNQPDLYLEVVTIQMAQLQEEVTIQDSSLAGKVMKLEAEIARLQNEVIQLQQNKVVATTIPTQARVLEPRDRPQGAKQEYQKDVSRIYEVLDCATRAHIEHLKQHWTQILARVSPQDRAKFNGTIPLAAGPGVALISFKSEIFCGMVQQDVRLSSQLEQVCREQLDEVVKIVYVLENEWQQVRQDYKRLRDKNGGKPLTEIKTVTTEPIIESGPLEIEKENEVIETVNSISEAFSIKKEEGTIVEEELIVEEEAVQVPESVSKAIELFGEENLIIHYDK